MCGRFATTMAVATWLLHVPAAAQPDLPFNRVRAIDARAREILLDAWNSSPTVRALVETLEGSDLIVQVETQAVGASFRARLRFVTAAPGCRFVRVSVKVPAPRRVAIPALAHELQHAVEISQANDVVDEETLIGLFRRIGRQWERGVSVFETEAALAVEARVGLELRVEGKRRDSHEVEALAPHLPPGFRPALQSVHEPR